MEDAMWTILYRKDGLLEGCLLQNLEDVREVSRTLSRCGVEMEGIGCDARTFLERREGRWYVSHLWEDFYTGEPSKEYHQLMKLANTVGGFEKGAMAYGL